MRGKPSRPARGRSGSRSGSCRRRPAGSPRTRGSTTSKTRAPRSSISCISRHEARLLETEVRHALEPSQGVGAAGSKARGGAEARAGRLAPPASPGAVPPLALIGRRRDRRSEAAAWVVRAGELAEQRVEGRSLLGRQRAEELRLELLGDRAQPLELPPAGGRDADDVAAPVLRIALPHDQLALLQTIEHRDEAARIDVERFGDRPLRLARALAEDGQDAVALALEALALDSLDRLSLEREAEPGQ